MKVNKAKLKDIGLNIFARSIGAPLGAVSANALDKIAFIGNMNPWLKGIGKIFIGAAIPELHNKTNDKVSIGLSAFGSAFAGQGGIDIAKKVMPALISGAHSDIMSGITVDEDLEKESEKVSGGDGVMGGVVE